MANRVCFPWIRLAIVRAGQGLEPCRSADPDAPRSEIPLP